MPIHFVTTGIVLRETETREADKMLTVLSRENGKISVIARGARRKNCRFAAATRHLAYSELTLYHRGEHYFLDDGATLALFSGLCNNLEAMALASYFAELAEAVANEELPAPELLSLLLNALFTLEQGRKSPALVKAAFELRLLALSGYEPLADACAVCGCENPAEPLLDASQGLLCCRACANGRAAFPLDIGSLAALRHILYGDVKRLYSFTLEGAAAKRLAAAAEGFVYAQLERKFRTLDFYKSLL